MPISFLFVRIRTYAFKTAHLNSLNAHISLQEIVHGIASTAYVMTQAKLKLHYI